MKAVFVNGEELSVRVIYRDPVHDFAFLRCSLEALKVRKRSRNLCVLCSSGLDLHFFFELILRSQSPKKERLPAEHSTMVGGVGPALPQAYILALPWFASSVVYDGGRGGAGPRGGRGGPGRARGGQ